MEVMELQECAYWKHLVSCCCVTAALSLLYAGNAVTVSQAQYKLQPGGNDG